MTCRRTRSLSRRRRPSDTTLGVPGSGPSAMDPGAPANSPDEVPMPTKPDVEEKIAECHERQKYDDATTALIRGYGPEILGVIQRLVRSEDAAADVFSV